jgi:hypothetical protein
MDDVHGVKDSEHLRPLAVITGQDLLAQSVLQGASFRHAPAPEGVRRRLLLGVLVQQRQHALAEDVPSSSATARLAR